MSRQLRLGPSAFGSKVACRGADVATVVQIAAQYRPELTWYIADVDAMAVIDEELRSALPVRVGEATRMIELASGISQFLDGVVLGARATIRFPAAGVSTSSERAETDADIEIRAFDTSYLQIDGRDESLLERIATIVAAAHG